MCVLDFAYRTRLLKVESLYYQSLRKSFSNLTVHREIEAKT